MGRTVLAQAKTGGRQIRAFARRPEARAELDVDVAAGDVTDQKSIVAALDGVDVVVSVLGSKPISSDTHLLENGTRNMVAAMEQRGVKRFICVTGVGAGSSRGHGPLWYDAIIRPTLHADKDRQEAVIESSGLDWTIVRPAVLVGKA